MNRNIKNWIPVIIVLVGLLFLYLIFFRDVFKREVEEWEGAILENIDHFMPVAQTNNPAVPPDTITTATPRLIAWINSIIEQVRPAVVGICVGDIRIPPPWQQGWQIFTPSGKRSVGTGIIVNPKGYVITNYHVVSLLGDITVSLFSPTGYREYPAKLISGSKTEDLALLKIISNEIFPYAILGDSNKVKVGDRVIAIGNPFGLTQTVTAGIISAYRKELVIGGIRMRNLFQTDVPINQGNSGGPLCNLDGEVIGINTAIYSPTEAIYTGVSFAIPINRAKKLFKRYINLDMKPITPVQARLRGTNIWPAQVTRRREPVTNYYRFVRQNPKTRIQPSPGEGIEEIAWLGMDLIPDNRGVEVDEIEGISPMEAGLQAGDIVLSVNGHPTPDIYTFKEVIKRIPLKVGQGIVLDIYRPRNNRRMFISFRIKKFDLQGR